MRQYTNVETQTTMWTKWTNRKKSHTNIICNAQSICVWSHVIIATCCHTHRVNKSSLTHVRTSTLRACCVCNHEHISMRICAQSSIAHERRSRVDWWCNRVYRISCTTYIPEPRCDDWTIYWRISRVRETREQQSTWLHRVISINVNNVLIILLRNLIEQRNYIMHYFVDVYASRVMLTTLHNATWKKRSWTHNTHITWTLQIFTCAMHIVCVACVR